MKRLLIVRRSDVRDRGGAEIWPRAASWPEPHLAVKHGVTHVILDPGGHAAGPGLFAPARTRPHGWHRGGALTVAPAA